MKLMLTLLSLWLFSGCIHFNRYHEVFKCTDVFVEKKVPFKSAIKGCQVIYNER